MKYGSLIIKCLILAGLYSIVFRGQDLPGVLDHPGLVSNSERRAFFADPCEKTGEEIQIWGYLHHSEQGRPFLGRNGLFVDSTLWALYSSPDKEASRALVYPPFATDESLSIYFNHENASKFIPVDMKALVSEVNVDGQIGGCVLRPREIEFYNSNNEGFFNFQAKKYKK